MCGCISQVRGEGRELRNCDAGGEKHREGNFLSNRKTNTVVMKTCLKMGHGVWGVVPVEGRTGTSAWESCFRSMAGRHDPEVSSLSPVKDTLGSVSGDSPLHSYRPKLPKRSLMQEEADMAACDREHQKQLKWEETESCSLWALRGLLASSEATKVARSNEEQFWEPTLHQTYTVFIPI